MSELLGNDPYEQIEALVRSAGGYVAPSDDLRPRVLETARMVRVEQRVQSGIGRFARWVVILAIFANAVGEQLHVRQSPSASNPIMANADDVFALAESRVVQGGLDVGWGLVEAFSDVRDRQAESLRPAL